MHPKPRRQELARPIPVSELSQWVCCNLAWKLKQLGVKPTAEATAKSDVGRAWHQEHGEAVVRGNPRVACEICASYWRCSRRPRSPSSGCSDELASALAMLLVVAALIAHGAVRKAAAASGLPGGGIRYQDTGGAPIPCATLVSTRYGLVGRPDYVVETAAGLVPVEIKSSSAPPLGPYDNHVAQLLGYCLLVEDAMGRPVTESILKYRDGEVRVMFTPERRERILGIIGATQVAQAGRPVGRSHNQANKCRGCSLRAGCWDRI